jgi:SAM-dependent methyltransferase
LEREKIGSIGDQMHQIAAVQAELRTRFRTEQVPSTDEQYRPARGLSFKKYLARARREFPRAYPFWRERLNAMRDAFAATKVGNAAHGGDVYSRLFKSFIETHANGRILDVGCGVFGRPFYLESYPAELISGIDPLKPVTKPDFEFVRGISEYLPWRPKSFSTVVSATSLDHCLSLDRSLSELERVLCDAGKLLLWIGSQPGASPYTPDRADFTPADKFHLFHFDAVWFEPLLGKRFEIVERMQFDRADFNHVMYLLTKRRPAHT